VYLHNIIILFSFLNIYNLIYIHSTRDRTSMLLVKFLFHVSTSHLIYVAFTLGNVCLSHPKVSGVSTKASLK